MVKSYRRFLVFIAALTVFGAFLFSQGCGNFQRNNTAAQSEAIITMQQEVARLERLNKINTRNAADIHGRLAFARSIVINPNGAHNLSQYCAESLSNLECLDSILALAEQQLIEAEQ